MSRHRAKAGRFDSIRRQPTSVIVAGVIVILMIPVLIVLMVMSINENERNLKPKPAPTVTKTVSLPQKTVTVIPKAANPDALSQARRFKPLSKLSKGDRVINEQNPARPLCTFELWGGSIDKAVIECGSSQQITVKTGYLTPIEVTQ